MDIVSDLESITSSNYEYTHDGSRRYHGIEGNRYPLPNDEEEVLRLDKLHYMFRCLFGANVLAPINPEPTAILDVGTGSGRWVIEVADEFDTAIVTGMDLSPAAPLFEFTENSEFIVGDLTDGLPFDDSTLDLVHSRIINAGVTKHQWQPYVNEIMRVLKPGGWVQCTEFRGHELYAEGYVPEDSAIREFDRNFHALCEEMGTFTSGEHLKELVNTAGFEKIRVLKKKIAIGTWRGGKYTEAGRTAVAVWSGAYVALIERLKKHYPIEEERKKFAERVVADLENPDYHLYSISHTVIGRKPEVKREY